jgi:hypothetical protein
MSILFTATERTLLPVGTYAATFTEVERRTGQLGDYLHWKFETEHDDQIVTLTANSSLNTGPSSKARKWVEALMGRRLGGGESLDLMRLSGRACLLALTQTDRDGVTYNAIDSVLAAPRTGAKPLVQAEPEDELIPF